jgi:hypothetical protein
MRPAGGRDAFFQNSQARPGDITGNVQGDPIAVKSATPDWTYGQAFPQLAAYRQYAENVAASNRATGGGIQTGQGIAASYASGQYHPGNLSSSPSIWGPIANGVTPEMVYQKGSPGTSITPTNGMPAGLGAGGGDFSDTAQQAQQVAGLNRTPGFADGGQIGSTSPWGYIQHLARGSRFPWEAGWATSGGSNKPEDQYSRGAAERRAARGYNSGPAQPQGPDVHDQANPNNARMANAERNAAGFADGGMPGAMPPAPPGQSGPGVQMPPSGPMNPQMADAHIQDLLTRNPQVKQQIQQVVQQAMASGELTPQMANMAVQLAQACVQNPALWPKLRQFAIQQGLAGPNDLPMQYDQGLVMTILIAARAAQGQGGMGGPQMGQAQQMGGPPGPGQPQAASMQGDQGGMLQGPGTGTSDSIPATNMATGGQVNLSNGEYIIPARVVAHKGREFFDNLVMKYNGRAPAA